jgi:hypothetical protein
VILAIFISPDSRPDFGDAPDQTRPNPINRDRARLIGIGQEPDFGDAPILAMTSSDLRIDISQKMPKMPDSDSLQSVPALDCTR